ncbi:MAG: GNAT family N-acetyltransferase [Acidimicrobiales bacterium]
MITEEVDVDDDEAFASWFRSLHASERYTWPNEPGWAENELRAVYRDNRDADRVLIVARDDDGSPVGSLDVSLPKRESFHIAYLILAVHPSHCGRGIGQELLARGEDVAREHGREKVLGWTDEPVQQGESRSNRFARLAGYSPGRVDARRELRLPMAPARTEAIESSGRRHAQGYEIVAWQGRCPDGIVEGRIALSQTISADAPRGELDYDEEHWDVERLRNWERQVGEMNRDLLAAGAVELATGFLVAFTEIGVPRATREVAYQLDTVVAPEHRGHRLGLLLKIANARALEEQSSTTRRVLTWNAVENVPMISVNEQMGYELVGIGTAWQKQLS